MTWFKTDDSFYDHPKVFDAPDCAVALWTRAGCWASRNLTDGFVPTGMPARLCDDPETAVKELVARGLWHRAKGGFQFHDWTDYNPTAARVKATRAARAEAGSRGGKAKAAKQTASKLLDDSQDDAKQNPAPTRPDPDTEEADASSGGAAKPRKRKADPIWDALMAACDVDTTQITTSSRGAYNNAVKDLKAVEAKPAQIILRARRFKDQWPGVKITPTALVRRWSELGTSTAPSPEADEEPCNQHPRHPKDHCQLCDSERRGAA
jgi:hypothetical protein